MMNIIKERRLNIIFAILVTILISALVAKTNTLQGIYADVYERADYAVDEFFVYTHIEVYEDMIGPERAEVLSKQICDVVKERRFILFKPFPVTSNFFSLCSIPIKNLLRNF